VTPAGFETTAVAWITAVASIIVAIVLAVVQVLAAIEKAKISVRVDDLERRADNHGKALTTLQLNAAPPAASEINSKTSPFQQQPNAVTSGYIAPTGQGTAEMKSYNPGQGGF
jgi:hypothetical protein